VVDPHLVAAGPEPLGDELVEHPASRRPSLRQAERITISNGDHIERGRAALLDAIESRYLR